MADATIESVPDDLWQEFAKLAPAFEARFKTEEDCRRYWIKARRGGKPACAKCRSTRVWPIRGGPAPSGFHHPRIRRGGWW